MRVSSVGRSLFLTATLAVVVIQTPAAATDRAADLAALTSAKVDVWRDLYRRHDADGLNEFLADGFVAIGPDGSVSTKAEAVRSLREEASDMPADFQFRVEDIVFLGGDAAIVYGTGESTRRDEQGAPCRHCYRSSNTFVRRSGTWKPILSHVSGVRCERMG